MEMYKVVICWDEAITPINKEEWENKCKENAKLFNEQYKKIRKHRMSMRLI